MAKTRGADVKLTRLQELRREPAASAHLEELRQALAAKSNFVVAAAAEIIATRGLTNLAPELAAAFDRFMKDPEETDKGCRALIAIVDALNKIEYDQEEIFLRAIRHVQMVYKPPKPEDEAAPLRGCGAFGLLRINYHELLPVLVELLADNEVAARVAAVQALGESRAAAVIPLLRYKARLGDEDPAVTAECLTALMTAAPKESLEFVSNFLDAPNPAIQEGAAFALGESRRADALAVLTQRWPQLRHVELREAMLLAISMTRLPAAVEFLLTIVAAEDQTTALLAVNVLAIHRHNSTSKRQIEAAVEKRGSDALKKQFCKKFDVP